MNALKRFGLGFATLAVVALALVSIGTVPALWADTSAPDTATDGRTEIQAQLWQMRNIMHYARFVATPVENGVRVDVTSDNEELSAAIRKQFGTDNGLPSPVPGSAAQAVTTEGGVALTFTSDDPALVPALQAQGAGLAYALLRNNMHAVMTALQANGNAYGPGWGRGWMHGGGMMGGGRMHGPGQGYGPRGGMMGPGYGPGQGYGPGPQAPQSN